MSFVLIFLVFNSLAFTLKSANGTRIISEMTADNRGQYAHQVSIRLKNKNFCGGAIITAQHIVTAAQCLYTSKNKPLPLESLKVVAGDLHLVKPTNHTTERNVIEAHHYKNYDHKTFTNDIAVLKLDKPFEEFNEFIDKTELAKTRPQVGQECIVSGWGVHTWPEGNTTNTLQLLKLPILGQKSCKLMYGDLIKPGMFCAGYMEDGIVPCTGDRGGPLECDGVLHGIVSWGEGCSSPNKTAVYTEVAEYYDWIIEHASNTDSLHRRRRGCVVLLCIVIYSYL